MLDLLFTLSSCLGFLPVGFRYRCKTTTQSGNTVMTWKNRAQPVVEGEHTSTYTQICHKSMTKTALQIYFMENHKEGERPI